MPHDINALYSDASKSVNLGPSGLDNSYRKSCLQQMERSTARLQNIHVLV